MAKLLHYETYCHEMVDRKPAGTKMAPAHCSSTLNHSQYNRGNWQDPKCHHWKQPQPGEKKQTRSTATKCNSNTLKSYHKKATIDRTEETKMAPQETAKAIPVPPGATVVYNTTAGDAMTSKRGTQDGHKIKAQAKDMKHFPKAVPIL